MKWIPELSLTGTEKQAILNYNYICDRIIDAAMTLLHQQKPFFMFQSTAFNHQFLQLYPFETIHVHHDGKDHFVTSTSVGGYVKLFDSLYFLPSEDLTKQILLTSKPFQLSLKLKCDPSNKVPRTADCLPLRKQQKLLMDRTLLCLYLISLNSDI